MKQVSYSAPTNIGLNWTKFGCRGDLVPGICVHACQDYAVS